MAIAVLKDYLQEYSGSIMVFSGILLLIVGLMFLQAYSSPVSAIGLFFGVILLAYGFFVRLGLFYSELRSLNGLGTILICVSVVFLALSIASIQYQIVTNSVLVPQYEGRRIEGYVLEVDTARPYVWLSLLSVCVSAALFLVAVIAKVSSSRR